MSSELPPHATFLIGSWECLDKSNNFYFTINWNTKESRYEGSLTKHSLGTRYVGFRLGELFWIATPTDNLEILKERTKWRTGLFGITLAVNWREGLAVVSTETKTLIVSGSNCRKAIG